MREVPAVKEHTAVSTYRWLREPYPYLDHLRATYGDAFALKLFAFDFVMFSNPDDVREIFSEGGEELEAGRLAAASIGPMLGNQSVLMTDGPNHLRKRKLLLPPFHGERMQAYGPTMLSVTDDAIDAMPHNRAFPFHEPMQDITLRVIIRTIFGFDGPRLEEMCAHTKRLLELGAWTPLLIPAMRFDWGRFSPYGRFKLARDESDQLLYREIDRRRESGERGADILSLLLDARDDEGKPMPREELRDELVTLLVAGHETTATALTWAMRYLLESPKDLEELRAEMDALGANPTPEAIAKAPFLDGVVRESLRLNPVIPIVGRVLTKDREVGGVAMKKDQTVVCSIYLAHRRPEAYADPLRFDPRRFIGKKFSAHEFFPFGGGIRRCIGMAFSLYEMKMSLARIVTRCDFELASHDLGMVRRSITVTPKNGLQVRLKKRRLRPSLTPTRISAAAE